jgi:hypothetical protein
MSTVLATYGPVYAVGFASRDGFRYRADVVRHGYTGPVTPLRGVALRIRGGVEGGAARGADPLSPVAPRRAVLTVNDDRPGRLAEVVGSPDGAWGLVVRRVSGGPSVERVVYRGLLQQEGHEDAPYGASGDQTLTFDVGLGLLDSRPAAGPGVAGRDDGGDGPYWAWTDEVDLLGTDRRAERVAVSLARALGPLAGDPAGVEDGGLVTAVDWRPWLPGTRVASATDPLHAVLTAEHAWLDEDGATASELDLVRGAVGRFGARLFQSDDRFHVVQRGLLARDATKVPRHTYPASAASPYGVAPTSTRTLDDLVVDTRHWPQLGPHGAPRRGVTVPVRSAEVAYDFRPDLDDLVLNGSFEEAGGTAEEAAYWDLDGGAERAVGDGYIDETASDRWVIQFPETRATAPRAKAVQDGLVYLPGSAGWELRVKWTQWVTQNVVVAGDLYPVNVDLADEAPYGGLLVQVGDHYLRRYPLITTVESFRGARVRVYVGRVLEGYGGAVADTPVIPSGVTVHFHASGSPVDLDVLGTLLLSEPVRVGDSFLAGDLTLTDPEETYLPIGAIGYCYVWTPGIARAEHGAGQYARAFPDGSFASVSRRLRYGTRSLFATGVTPAGLVVQGPVHVEAWGGDTLADAGRFADAFTAIDGVEVAVEIDRDGPATIAARAVLPAGTPGLDVSLPASRGGLPVGDGPMADSLTGLHAEGADGEVYPTTQGADTGWTEGTYGVGAASTGKTIDLVHARSSLAQLAGATAPTEAGGGLERLRTTFLLRDGAILRPDQVVQHWPLTSLALPAVEGAETVYLHGAPRVGRTVEVPAGSGNDYTVESVTRGAGLFAVALASPLTTSTPAGARVAYDALFWWDGDDWDVPAGALYYDATALDLCDPTTFAEEVTLGPG